jgi:hypothetical protein
MAEPNHKRARLACTGLILFLLVTTHRAEQAPEYGSGTNVLIGVMSTLVRLPAALRVFVEAAMVARQDGQTGR